jgi:arabinose-5-phosphate isomerase
LPKQTNRTESDLAAAERVLRLEAEGLQALTRSLDAQFSRALDLLMAVRGRVIVSGMGKSGHIARKIAATLASTGSPALYVHPGEASHGDLGMITREDAIMALSNSGETSELSDLVAYAARMSIPLIAITGKTGSSLAESAEVALTLPKTEEACPMGLAPTTSTTLMLGLGDALAVALLQRKGFSANDFHELHPGGMLGRQLLRVRDIMHGGDALPLVDPDMRMADALLVMTSKTFGCAGVVDENSKLIGIVTDGDLRRHMDAHLLDHPVHQVMTGGPTTIRPQALAAEAVAIMNDRAITSLFVIENDRPIGILHIHDCLRAGVT